MYNREIQLSEASEINPDREYRDQVRAITEYLSGVGKEIHAEYGIQTSDNLRIDAEQFSYDPSEKKADREKSQEVRDYFAKRDKQDKVDPGQRQLGEDFEILITALLHKYLGDDYIVLRTTDFDDIGDKGQKNGVDNILVHKKSGIPICTLDEVATMYDDSFKGKKDKVDNLNSQGGVDVKYGVSLKKGRFAKMESQLGALSGLPVFYLGATREQALRAIKEFNPKSSDSGPDEEKLYKQVLVSFLTGIVSLEGEEKFSKKVKRGLDTLEKIVRQKMANIV